MLHVHILLHSDSHVLTEDQNRWIDKIESRVYELMAETPPYGEKFGRSVKHILHREEQWNIWKNQGCKSLIAKPPAAVEDDTSAKNVDPESKESSNAMSSTFFDYFFTVQRLLGICIFTIYFEKNTSKF